MKQDKVINSILLIVNVVLAVVCVAFYLRTDRTEPRFIIKPAEIIYTPGMDAAALYEGIEAYDECDGELTDKIVIEKTVENSEEGTVIIYYAVSDAAGNVSKFSKLFQANYPVEVSMEVNEAERENRTVRELEQNPVIQDDAVTAEDAAEGAGAAANEQEIAEGDVGLHEDDEEGDGLQEDDEETADGEESESNEDDSEEETQGGADDMAVESPAALEQTAAGSSAPELVFRTTEVTVDAGANVPWTEIISTLRDDKDDYATLYYNLHVGQYNRNKAGTYRVNVYTEDSDGNRSAEVPVTITVR